MPLSRSRSIHSLFGIGFAITLSACSSPEASAPADSPPFDATSAPLEAPGSPLVVTLEGPNVASEGEIELTLEITRSHPTNAPLEIHVEAPKDTSLVDGATDEKIVDPTSRSIERRYRLRIDRVPSEDVRIDVSMRGVTYGASSRAFYRFGRPEPKLGEPSRGARAIVIEKRNLGAPIPVHR